MVDFANASTTRTDQYRWYITMLKKAVESIDTEPNATTLELAIFFLRIKDMTCDADLSRAIELEL